MATKEEKVPVEADSKEDVAMSHDEAGDEVTAPLEGAFTAESSAEAPPSLDDKGKRVYVGNLSWAVSGQDLKDHMNSTGLEAVRANIMKGHDGRSKGCGIVEFATSDDAAQAILTLNNTELKGRQIFVREDREANPVFSSTPSTGAGIAAVTGGGGAHRFSSGEQSQRVYVGNLSWDVAWQDLKDHMRQAGEVVHAEIMTDQHSGRSKGCGIVEFATKEEAEAAIGTLSNTELNGRTIFVREDRETVGKAASAGPAGLRSSNPSVYVWNLAAETSWQDLKDHMRKAGNVDSATIFTNNHDDFNSGIVVYQRAQDASRAVRELQGTELHGMPLSLREDRMGGGRGYGGGRGGGARAGGRGRGGRGSEGRGRGGGRSDAGKQVFVSNLSEETSWRELKDHFRQCGDVRRAEVMTEFDGGSTGTGTVTFATGEDAEAAVELLNGSELQGSKLEVRVR